MDSPRAWNYEIPGVTNKCIHDLFAEQVLAQPNAPAICAWDGKMSYSVLDNLSTTLAGYLVKIGVKPEDVVPLCFEKSMWTVVAMLAVLKAGGAFAQLDPDHPASRHKEILRQTSARVFTSYTFDFCMAEIITTLLYGGCICVPSDRDRRSDLAKAINAMGANWAL
ncbi:hypothetical protein P3342_011839 [Pyrenophora teres f. teres]|nr:hypothetical protein P3342_011839 [Pyrenophora teres f. teres]